MGRADLIGNGKKHLVPSFQPAEPAIAAANRQPPLRSHAVAPALRRPEPPSPATQATSGVDPDLSGLRARPDKSGPTSGSHRSPSCRRSAGRRLAHAVVPDEIAAERPSIVRGA